jgi:hypothetical protein
MNTAANLILILSFLSALYLVLALFSAGVERTLVLLERHRQRRRARAVPRRRTPRRPAAPAGRLRQPAPPAAMRPAA